MLGLEVCVSDGSRKKLNQGSERYIYIYKKRASKRIGAALGQKKKIATDIWRMNETEGERDEKLFYPQITM